MGQNRAAHSVNAANRMDRLPICSAHRLLIVAIAFAYFFDISDISTFSFAAPTLSKIWHLSIPMVALITAATFGGMCIGALVNGWIADRIGRKRSLMLATGFYSLFSLLSALAWNPVSLGIFRCLTGIGLASMLIVASTYVSEFFPAVSRGKFMGWVVTIGLAGTPATSWVALFVVSLGTWGWRLIFVWGALGIVALFLLFRVEESPRWYETYGHTAQTEEALKRLEAIAIAEKGALPPAAEPVPQPVVHSVPYRELFEGKYRSRTIMLMAVWIFQALGYYGYRSWVPLLLVSRGFSVTTALTFSSVIALGIPFGALLAAYISDRVERRWAIAINAVFIALFAMIFGIVSLPVLVLVFGFLVEFITAAVNPLLTTYTPELYPTEARASGVGLTYSSSRLANVIGPFIVGALLTGPGSIGVFVYIAISWLLAGLAVGLFGPLTSRRSLESINQSEIAQVPVASAT